MERQGIFIIMASHPAGLWGDDTYYFVVYTNGRFTSSRGRRIHPWADIRRHNFMMLSIHNTFETIISEEDLKHIKELMDRIIEAQPMPTERFAVVGAHYYHILHNGVAFKTGEGYVNFEYFRELIWILDQVWFRNRNQ